jgi:hypothetical protein
MISRMPAAQPIIFKKHSQACLADPEMDLNEQNIYNCSNWWPGQLAFVPKFARTICRKKLNALWEAALDLFQDYDMSWKDWADDLFEPGRKPEIRKDLSLKEK